MAKHCDTCKQAYSDDLLSCPHCAEEGVIVRRGRPIGSPRPTDAPDVIGPARPAGNRAPAGSESAIEIGLPPVASDRPAVPTGSESDIQIGLPPVASDRPAVPTGSESDVQIGLPPVASDRPAVPTGSESDIQIGLPP